MDINVRFSYGILAYVIVTDGNTEIVSEVADINGKVDKNFIQSLRDVADSLENFNS